MNNTIYVYALSIKLDGISGTNIGLIFDGVTDILINSNDFTNYTDAVDSANKLMGEVLDDLNKNTCDRSFVLFSEINPIYCEEPGRADDWEDSEMARIWILDEVTKEENVMQAVAELKMISLVSDEPHYLN
jgi:hypothetical protein